MRGVDFHGQIALEQRSCLRYDPVGARKDSQDPELSKAWGFCLSDYQFAPDRSFRLFVKFAGDGPPFESSNFFSGNVQPPENIGRVDETLLPVTVTGRSSKVTTLQPCVERKKVGWIGVVLRCVVDHATSKPLLSRAFKTSRFPQKPPDSWGNVRLLQYSELRII